MGLDISYYSNAQEITNWSEGEGDSTSYNGCFEYQLGSLKKNTYYDSTQKSKYGSFCAGSYSGYNYWRNQLAILAGYSSAENVWNDFNTNIRYQKLKKIENKEYKIKSFYEIICFSDCEGIIGPEICKKLYEDFYHFEHKAKEYDEYFRKKYLEWKEAFRVASENGLVSFH